MRGSLPRTWLANWGHRAKCGRHWELNPGPSAHQTDVLPTELTSRQLWHFVGLLDLKVRKSTAKTTSWDW